MIRKLLINIQDVDRKLHEYLWMHFHVAFRAVDLITSCIYKVMSHTLFGIIISLLFVPMVIVNKTNLVIAIPIILAWWAAMIWLFRAEWARHLYLPARSVILILLAILLAWGGNKYARWCVTQYHQPKQPTAQEIAEEVAKRFEPAKPIFTTILPQLEVTPMDIEERPVHTILKVHILNYSNYVAKNISVDIKFGDNLWRHEQWKAVSSQYLSQMTDEKTKEIVKNFINSPFLDELKPTKALDIYMPDMNRDMIRKMKLPVKPEESAFYQESQGWKEIINNTESGKSIKILLRAVWKNENGQRLDQTVGYQLICTKVGIGRSYTFLPTGNITKNYN